jgi:hypothetical protein
MPRVRIAPALPDRTAFDVEIARLRNLNIVAPRSRWHSVLGRQPPPHLSRHLLFRILAYRLQADRLGDLDNESQCLLDSSGSPEKAGQNAVILVRHIADVRPGTSLGREWNGRMQRVTVLAKGFVWNGKTYSSLSQVADLRQQGIVTKVRILKTGETVGGIPFRRGSLAHLLRNRFYIGEVAFGGEVFKGEQPAILDKDLFDAVQAKLNEQVDNHKAKWTKSEGLLIGRLFDDRGNRMSPSHVRKGNVKYRYYLSAALLQGTAARAGSVRRVPATEIEALVVKSIRDHLRPVQPIDDRSLLNTHIARVEVQPDQLVIHLEDPSRTLQVPWQKTPARRRREILLPEGIRPEHARPIRSETRARLVAAIARGRRWLGQLLTKPTASADSIAKRENCSARKINMTISLAFLAPELVKAAIDGRLPHGMGVARLTDLPAEWSRQHQMLGLPARSPHIRDHPLQSYSGSDYFTQSS